MKLNLLAGAALASLMAAPAAFAQVDDWSATEPGWYGALDAGGHHVAGQRLTSPTTGIGLLPLYTDPEFVAFARIGYRLNPHLRLEIEGGWRHEGIRAVEPLNGGPYACAPGSGAGTCESPAGGEHAWTGMANVLFDILPHSRINPFVGGGVGVAKIHLDEAGVCNGVGCTFPQPLLSIDNGTTRFAYQGIAGISYRATDRVNVDLTYHYTRSDGYRVYDPSIANAGIDPDGVIKGSWADSAVTLGLRYSFATPPAPPPPPPPPPVDMPPPPGLATWVV